MADPKTSLEAVHDLLPQLPEQQQREVQFVALPYKTAHQLEQDDSGWNAFSLQSAMRGTKDEDMLYSEDDLQEVWTET